VSPISPEVRIETAEFRDRKQSAMVLGYRTVPRNHQDWPPLRLLRNVTSGLSGTFFAELRGRQSLAYTVFASEQSMADAGFFFAYLASDADKEEAARKALLHEIQRLQSDGVDEETVAKAQASYAGSNRIGLQTNAARAGVHADNHFYGLGLDFTERSAKAIAALTGEDLRNVAKKYLAHDHYVAATLKGAADEP
jgi:zinc protease